MGGFLHLYIGQESIAVGTISRLGDNDHVITAYRDHGHAIPPLGMGSQRLTRRNCMARPLALPTAKAAQCTSLPRTRIIGVVTASLEAILLPWVSASPTESRTKGLIGAALMFPWRWRGQSGLLLRMSQHGLPVRLACHLHHREQQVFDGDQRESLPEWWNYVLPSGQRFSALNGSRAMARTFTQSGRLRTRRSSGLQKTTDPLGHLVSHDPLDENLTADAKHKGGYRKE